MDAKIPRYRQLADELRAKVLADGFADSGFPTETQLCAQYGVSRFTVREALRALQAEGLISRRRGSGTSVAPASARAGALHQPLSNFAEILQYADSTRIGFTAADTVTLPRALAEELGQQGRWTHFRGLRVDAGGTAIALTDAYLHPDLAGIAAAIDPNGKTIFRQVERLARLKIARVTQDIQAVAASIDMAAALGIRRRAPCLRILRCYFDESGRLFEISASHHPGDRFAYNMHIDVEG